MRYLALACDYDGTLAHHGVVSDETLAALEREHIKDDSLAQEAARIETAAALSAQESRAGIREAIERRYTAPA